MGANVLQSYLIKLGVQIDRKGLDGFVGGIYSALGGLAKMGAAAVGAFSMVQVGVMKLAASESALNDLSERVGTSVENIERMSYVASQMGSSTGAMQSALDNLSRMAGGAAMGLAGAVRAFGDIGVNVRDANGAIKDTSVLMDEVGRAISHLDKNSQIFALERLGIDRTLIKTLTKDTCALAAEFNAMAGATGVSFERSSKAASELMDEMNKTRSFAGLLSKALGTTLMEDLVKGLQRARRKIQDNFLLIRDGVDLAIKVIKAGTLVATTFLDRLGQALVWLHDKTSGASTALLALKVALMFISAPAALIAGALLAVFLAVDDLWTALEGGKSYLDWSPWLGQIRSAHEWLKSTAKVVRDYLAASLKKAWDWLKGMGPTIQSGFVSGLEKTWNWFKKIGAMVKEEFLVCLADVKAWMDRVVEAFDYDSWVKGVPATIDLLKSFMSVLVDIAGYIAGSAWDVVKLAFGVIGKGVESAIKIIKELADLFVNLVYGDFTGAVNNLKNIFGEVGSFIEKVFDAALGTITSVIGTIGKAIDRVKEFLGLGGDKGQDTAAAHRPRGPYSSLPAQPTYSIPMGGGRPTGPFSFATPPALPPGMSLASLGRVSQTTNNAGDVSQNITNNYTINAGNADAGGVVRRLREEESRSKSLARYGQSRAHGG